MKFCTKALLTPSCESQPKKSCGWPKLGLGELLRCLLSSFSFRYLDMHVAYASHGHNINLLIDVYNLLIDV